MPSRPYHDPSNPTGQDRSVSVVVPTYREADNLPHLIERLNRIRQEHGLCLELLIMDDNSQDGTVDLIDALDLDWVHLVVRTEDRGLSPAVVEGLGLVRHGMVIVMDADLSHPPEKIPEMLQALAAGHDFVIGSRYISGGTTDAEWGPFRWLVSKVATALARPLTDIRDPMAGFFALRKASLDGSARRDGLSPVGYKIGLELIVKCRFQKVLEIPIHFTERQHGQSKLTLKEQLRYIKHLRRLYTFKFGIWSHLAQFLVVGLSGTLVNLGTLTALLWLNLPVQVAVGVAIALSMISNFALNRRFTFSYARERSLWKQFIGFIGACSIGAIANYLTTIGVYKLLPGGLKIPQLAALAGIAVGMIFNFLINRFIVFRTNPQRDRTMEPN